MAGQAVPLIRMREIRKRFGRVEVLRGVELDAYSGEVHILAGENGAGKSTLMKILGGVYPQFDGTVELNGRPFKPRSPLHANDLGIAVIYQELSLIPAMSVADNIYLGRTLTAAGGFVRQNRQRDEARKLLDRLGMAHIDVEVRVERLPIGSQQMVEIAKAMVRDASVVVMDEPTSALSSVEVERLFDLVASLKRRGCAIIYITHKMEEIERIADRITVLRDGRYVGSALAGDLPIPKLISWMVGREVEQQFPRHAPAAGEISLALNNVSVFNHQGGRAVVDSVNVSGPAGRSRRYRRASGIGGQRIAARAVRRLRAGERPRRDSVGRKSVSPLITRQVHRTRRRAGDSRSQGFGTGAIHEHHRQHHAGDARPGFADWAGELIA